MSEGLMRERLDPARDGELWKGFKLRLKDAVIGAHSRKED
jgi:hypothetical protein